MTDELQFRDYSSKVMPNTISSDTLETEPMTKHSRLRRNLEKQDKKQVVMSLLGIVILLFGAVRFGPPAVAFISDVFIGINEKNAPDETKNAVQEILPAPFLDTIPYATNSASIFVSGTSTEKKGEIEIYLNGDVFKTITLKKDGAFVQRVTGLTDGTNTIKARFIGEDDKKSNYTQEYIIVYSKKGPELEVSSPSDGQEFRRGNEEILVQGKTNPENTVTVNGFRAIVSESGNFSYYLKLTEGDNIISIEATSPADVITKKEIKVIFNP